MEAEDLTEEWRKLRLSEEEDEVRIEFDPQLGNIMNDQMEYCLIGKLLSTRTIVLGIIKNTIANPWRTNLGFNVESLVEISF